MENIIKLPLKLLLLSTNFKHSGLCSHKFDFLSEMAGFKTCQSYIENHTPAAGRIFWAYGLDKIEITILGFEPHPEGKKSLGYGKVKLSEIPEIDVDN